MNPQKLPKGKTCNDCKLFDVCNQTNSVKETSTKCEFPFSKFEEVEKETVYITLLLSRPKRRNFVKFAEKFGMVDYISHDYKSFGIMCTPAGASVLSNGLKLSAYYKGITEILVNGKPQHSILMTT